LWIVHKDQNEITEIKGTKKAIGGLTEDSQQFETHTIQLKEGDTFYIFSDGYADLFGKGGKKLTTKKFKQVILDIQDKTMNVQGKYLEYFSENWKSGIEQIDDILVIGLRV
jgi:serine phosphatase RsbU (regulator of sigma subunit)